MKRLFPFVVGFALITFSAAQTPARDAAGTAKQPPAQTADFWYAKGQAAEKDGDPEAAKRAYEAALKVNPNHAQSRFQLGQVKLNAAKISAAGREAKFGAVMIPEFNIAEASLAEALRHLGKLIEKQSEGKVVANFVIQDAGNVLGAKKIDLQLKNTPARAIMKYLMEQSGAKARHDEFAIVIMPMDPAK